MTFLNNILIFGLFNAVTIVILQHFVESLYKKKNEMKKIYNRDNLKLFFIVLGVSMVAFKLLNSMSDSGNSLTENMEVQRGIPDF